jgi:transcriptional regulator with XRE-family HTH domain
MHRFGEKLRTLRMKHGMTVRELAQALGYTAHSHVGEVERGHQQPSIEFALKVSRLFNVTMDQLTKDELDLDEESAHEP